MCIRDRDSGGTAEDGASDRLENAKMIYTARMEVETTAFDTADADLRTLVEVLGGYFEQAAVHDYGSGYRSGDYKAVSYTHLDVYKRQPGWRPALCWTGWIT